MKITMQEVVHKMADSLIEAANREEVSLVGIPTDSGFNSFLDDLFKDGGEIRCEQFADLAWEYSLQFGKLESDPFEKAQWECIIAALKEVRFRVGAKS